MRRYTHAQLSFTSFTAPLTGNDRFEELQEIDRILDAIPNLVERVYTDLVQGIDPSRGREALASEQVLRTLIVKQANDYTYEDLEFYLADSPTYRWFCRLDCNQCSKKSSMQRAIKRLSPETLEAINQDVVRYALEQGIENARKVGTDCTGVEAMIHEPG